MFKNIFLTILVMNLLPLSGCRKVCDYFEQHQDSPATNCRIEKISFDILNDFGVIERCGSFFSYNTYNNPTLVGYSIPYDLPPMDKVFRYDANNRLSAYIKDFRYEDTSPVFWHKYTYESPLKVIDSVFVYASGDYKTNDRPDEYSRVEVNELTLDNRGRIINEKYTLDGNIFGERSFQYDMNGNLIKPGVTYNNKPNIRQTSKIWQFIDRDFSVNQPRDEVEAFTANNLPYTFRNPISTQSEILYIAQGSIVTYNCESVTTHVGVNSN